MTKHFPSLFVAALCAVSTVCPSGTAQAGEGFFQKIGDGWKNVIPKVQLKSPQELLPVCWGSPQECRDDNQRNGTQTHQAQARVSVSYRVDCRDRDTGRDRADNTVTVSAPTRAAAVAEIERLARTTELCQANGDSSRVTVPGSGRYLN